MTGPGAKFDPTVPARLEARQIDGGRLLFVRPAVNGKVGPWFLFDPGDGALTMMTTAAADRLGLPAFGEAPVVGAGQVKIRLRRAASFRLGPATVENAVIGELPQEFADAVTRRAGVEVTGVVGGDFLDRAVVEVDYQSGAVAAHDPATYRPPAGVTWERVHFSARMPCVKGTFEGKHAGLFVFDPAQEAKLTLHAPAVRRLDLLAGRGTTPGTASSAGGDVFLRAGTAFEFQVLGRTVKPIDAWFSTATGEQYGDPYTLGTFGLAMLGPGTVVFDYPNRRVAFVPAP